MTPRRPLLHAPLPALLALSAACTSLARISEERCVDLPHVPGSSIDVRSTNGGITVEGDSALDHVVVTSRVSATGATSEEAAGRLEAIRVLTARGPRGTLHISVEYPGERHSGEGCSFSIRVPDAEGVAAKTSNGSIRIANLRGAAELSSSNGRIVVDHHDGEVRATTSNGAIHLSAVSGPLRAETSNGPVEVRMAGDFAEISTSNGSLHYEAAPANEKPFDLRTSNGSMAIFLSPLLRGTIETRTSNGRVRVHKDASRAVRVSGSRHSKTIFLSESGPRSRARTSNGTISIHLR